MTPLEKKALIEQFTKLVECNNIVFSQIKVESFKDHELLGCGRVKRRNTEITVNMEIGHD